MNMQAFARCSEFVSVLGMPTNILKYGKIVPGTTKALFLIIPGNPGIMEFYDKFMEKLYDLSGRQVPVWGVSHAGHVTIPPDLHTLELEKLSYDVCSLNGQIRHKVTYIKENIPVDVKLVLIGHSIGCYMILKMLDDIDSHTVLRCFQLFPTIERMAASPNGIVATPLLRYFRWLLVGCVHGTTCFSEKMKYRLVLWYFKNKNVPDCTYSACMNLFDTFCTANSLYMANEEMQTVHQVDLRLVQKHLSKLSFYYGQNDMWCPKKYFYDMKELFPDGDIKLGEEGFEHAFVLTSNEEMADEVWNWVQTDFNREKVL